MRKGYNINSFLYCAREEPLLSLAEQQKQVRALRFTSGLCLDLRLSLLAWPIRAFSHDGVRQLPHPRAQGRSFTCIGLARIGRSARGLQQACLLLVMLLVLMNRSLRT